MVAKQSEQPASTGLLARWSAIPLYVRILAALVMGLVTGLLLGGRAAVFEIPSQVILQLLGALAPPLILVAVTHVIMTTEISRRMAGRLAVLLLLNTTVAILIGLAVANTLRPGSWSRIEDPAAAAKQEIATTDETKKGEGTKEDAKKDEGAKRESKADTIEKSPVEILLENVPKSILGPLGDRQNVIGVIIIALAFGVALRGVKTKAINNVQDFVELAYEVLLCVLHWVIQLVPIGVFAIVARVIGTHGFGPLKAMGAFVFAVLIALLLQSIWYLLRIRLFSWPRPIAVLRGMRDALVMAFSTGSSTATMPVTYACLTEKVGVRQQSASMGALVGANFNNDGTALYEAMSALFVAQMLGQQLSLWHQVLIVLTSIMASVGAAGIPEAGLVTMTLVFTAVGLPIKYIALLLTVDWFLDRCRTTINVLGDVNVSCLLDGKTKQTVAAAVEPSPVATS